MDTGLLKERVAASFAEHQKLYIAVFLAFVAGYGLCSGIRYLSKGADIGIPAELPTATPDIESGADVSGGREELQEMLLEYEVVEAVEEPPAETDGSLPASSKSSSEILSKLAGVKDAKVEVQVLMAGKRAESAKTAKCYNWFRNQEYHVEVVIPKHYADSELWWMRCDSSWPEIYLTLEIDGEVLKSPVKLVGARRNGNADTPVLLISQKIAQDLGLDGWKSYKSRAVGHVSIALAK